MSNVDWQNRVSDLPRNPLPDRYKPRALHLDPVEDDDLPRPMKAPVVDLRKLERELGRRRLDEIAHVVRTLTYGEMIELATSMWNVKPDGTSLTEHSLPAVLHRWSTSRQS
ncbi:MAG TPA: hypothetical protein VKP67_07005 [Xanthobacteraceae bacterium]|nr:hypothetical protein [Xanthobacteraceae bacterium]